MIVKLDNNSLVAITIFSSQSLYCWIEIEKFAELYSATNSESALAVVWVEEILISSFTKLNMHNIPLNT